MKNEALGSAVNQSEIPGQGVCGIVMPMSAADDYTEAHWAQIRTIIEDAAREAGFTARMVSTNANPGILQSNFVTNLYQDEIVVCDVSNGNANAMLELGIRIAFGKPFIIIKDTVSSFSSDISPAFHVMYDREVVE